MLSDESDTPQNLALRIQDLSYGCCSMIRVSPAELSTAGLCSFQGGSRVLASATLLFRNVSGQHLLDAEVEAHLST
ncbi:MAG: hypothetical protein KC561_21210, partial [Myxococcales bacterium]|nr:hypothetical protein [Myxococcales bacterium]